MDSQSLVAAVGKSEDSPEVQAVLAAVGWTKKLKLPKDDIDVRAELPALGLSLIFEAEGPKSSRLVLAGVQFVSSREKGFKSYAGALPARLMFDDDQAAARAKLGKPAKALPALRRDIWKFEGSLQLAINYAKDAPKTIALVTVEVPVA